MGIECLENENYSLSRVSWERLNVACRNTGISSGVGQQLVNKGFLFWDRKGYDFRTLPEEAVSEAVEFIKKYAFAWRKLLSPEIHEALMNKDKIYRDCFLRGMVPDRDAESVDQDNKLLIVKKENKE